MGGKFPSASIVANKRVVFDAAGSCYRAFFNGFSEQIPLRLCEPPIARGRPIGC